MSEFIQNAHSGWAYLTLLFLVIAVANSIFGYVSKKEFLAKDRKLALLALIVTHIQFVLGLLLYFTSLKGFRALKDNGFGAVMKNDGLRLTAFEHPFVNLIAIMVITIGWSKHKKLTDSTSKFKTFQIFYGVGLLLLLSRIPWDLWF